MSGELVLLALQDDPNSSGFQLVVAVLSAISVFGAAVSTAPYRRLRRTADRHLGRTLMLSRLFASLAIATFALAVFLAVVVDASVGEVLLTFLCSGGFGSVALLLNQNSESAQRFAMRANEAEVMEERRRRSIADAMSLISEIENPELRDQLRADTARTLLEQGDLPVTPERDVRHYLEAGESVTEWEGPDSL
ncbi:hypothetical protein [Nocardia gamkensis]|uniref:hypothetical protein n=1 Tax=Nocardia gamkensis TaxID=352869 RepID=UPI0037C4F555